MPERNLAKNVDVPLKQNCTAYNTFAFNLVYFPFEALKYNYQPIGFGTFLAYFSQFLGLRYDATSESGLLNSNPLNSHAKLVRKYMIEVLQNMYPQSELSNLTPYDLTQMLQEIDNGFQNEASFSKPIQYDFGCKNSNYDLEHRIVSIMRGAQEMQSLRKIISKLV